MAEDSSDDSSLAAAGQSEVRPFCAMLTVRRTDDDNDDDEDGSDRALEPRQEVEDPSPLLEAQEELVGNLVDLVIDVSDVQDAVNEFTTLGAMSILAKNTDLRVRDIGAPVDSLHPEGLMAPDPLPEAEQVTEAAMEEADAKATSGMEDVDVDLVRFAYAAQLIEPVLSERSLANSFNKVRLAAVDARRIRSTLTRGLLQDDCQWHCDRCERLFQHREIKRTFGTRSNLRRHLYGPSSAWLAHLLTSPRITYHTEWRELELRMLTDNKGLFRCPHVDCEFEYVHPLCSRLTRQLTLAVQRPERRWHRRPLPYGGVPWP
jgi:hypothetical protein